MPCNIILNNKTGRTWLGHGVRCLGTGWAAVSGWSAIALRVTYYVYSIIIFIIITTTTITIIAIIIFPSFSVLLNCLYLNLQVLPFSSDSLPHLTAGGISRRLCGV